MIKLSLLEIAKYLNCSMPAQDIIFQGICTDTRTLTPGCLFVAIRGEQFDAHDFANDAVKKGAVALLVNRPLDLPVPQLVVNDTLEAFGKISTLWRSRFHLPIVGVTGSNGKTTLKNMIASILRAACQNDASQVLATEGNLNNNIGVPIMLCRLNETHRYAVIEMGMNHFGEIDYLTHLTQPQVAIVNNAAEAHLEGLKDVAGVAKAKGEIFSGLKADGIAILNRDDAYFDYWRTTCNHSFLSFGLNNHADVTATFSGNNIKIKTPAGEIAVTLPLLGKHNVQNALAATAAALALHIDLTAIKTGLENMHAAPGRMNLYTLENGTRIIDDTYNANPFSTRAAADTLATFSGKKIMVLGDMKELGPNAKQLHTETGEHIRQAGIDYLFTFGDLSAAAAASFHQNAQHFTDREQLIAALKPYLTPDVIILIKGSRSMRMEKIVAGVVPDKQLEHLH